MGKKRGGQPGNQNARGKHNYPKYKDGFPQFWYSYRKRYPDICDNYKGKDRARELYIEYRALYDNNIRYICGRRIRFSQYYKMITRGQVVFVPEMGVRWEQKRKNGWYPIRWEALARNTDIGQKIAG